jgi:hypothetical protein
MKLNYDLKDLRVDKETKEKIQHLSEDLGLRQSEIIRMLLKEALRKIPRSPEGKFEVGLILNRSERGENNGTTKERA